MKNTLPTGPMNRRHLAEAVAAELGVSPGATEVVISTTFDVIARNVTAGHPVTVTNFGRWYPVQMQERMRRNPGTGDPVLVPASQEIRFRISPRLRALVRSADAATATIRKGSRGWAARRRPATRP